MVLLFFQLSDFDVNRLIAHGAEGAVFFATCQKRRHPNTSKKYALKTMFNIYELTSVTQVGKIEN